MTKLFKNSKNALAFVLAFAVIAVSLFTGVAINANAATSKSVIYYDGDAGVEPTETDANGNILIKTANHLRWLAQTGGVNTAGKTYKVDDSIGTIVLQTSANVTKAGGLDALKALDANGVKEWFGDPDTATWSWKNGLSGGKAEWNVWQNSGAVFQGTLDGNGVTIYGMNSGDGISGLFEQADNATIKNLTIKSSLAYGYGGGLLVGKSNLETESSVDDYVRFENCTLANNVVYTTRKNSDSHTNSGVLCGVIKKIKISNCLVYGNIARNKDDTDAVTGNTLALFGRFYNAKGCSIANSIILGVTPYKTNFDNGTNQGFAWDGIQPAVYSNVYTDQNTKSISWMGSSSKPESYIITYSDAQIKHIDATTLSAVTKEMTSGLDYTNTWIMTVNGPQLRALHGNFVATSNGADGHTLACEDCGLKTSTTTEPHTYDKTKKDGKCTACGYDCEHKNGTTDNKISATCTEAGKTEKICNDCGKVTKTTSSGRALGHDKSPEHIVGKAADCSNDGVIEHYKCSKCQGLFTDSACKNQITDVVIKSNGHTTGDLVTEIPATCEGTGTKAHYVCSGCNGKFYDKAGTQPATDADLTIPPKGHTAKKDNDGKIIYKQVDGKHYKICSVCSTDENEKLFGEEVCTCDEFTANNNGTHSGACKVCGLQVTENCTLEKVEKVDATTEKAGVKEHYKCSVCEALYEDAEGKTPTTLEKLAIAKVENKTDDAGKEDGNNNSNDNNNSNNSNTNNTTTGTTTTPTVNGDKNNESPKTGDSVATISVAILAIIAAGYVLVRKFVKA